MSGARVPNMRYRLSAYARPSPPYARPCSSPFLVLATYPRKQDASDDENHTHALERLRSLTEQ